MGGYVKGVTVEAELRALAAAYHRAVTAIAADSDDAQAFRDVSKVGAFGQRITEDVSGLRALRAARMYEDGRSYAEIAAVLGMSRSRASQLVRTGQERGPVMTDPGTDPEPPPVAAAIVTSEHGVLIERRRDKIPPWTFPATEMIPGESPAAAVLRKTPQETGVAITGTDVIGRRIHPKTGRVMIYLTASPAGSTRTRIGDPDDLAEVKWATLEEVNTLMPDMFAPAREYLAEALR